MLSETTITTKENIEILIYGLGAIGSFYAFILSRSAQVRLSVIARSNYSAVKDNGILLRSENHGTHRFHPDAVFSDSKEAGAEGLKYDYVVVASKAVELDKTVEELNEAGLILESNEEWPGTTVVVMQNGVGNEEIFLNKWNRITIISAVIWVGATQLHPGIILQHISESTTLGLFNNPHLPTLQQQSSLDMFTSLLKHGNHPHTTTPTIQTPRWQKCIWNAAWNTLTTLSTVDVHSWLESSPYAMSTTKRLMREAIHVARAEGIPGIEESLVHELIGRMQGFTEKVWTSMYYDARAGRAMEVDVIVGSIVRKGRERGVEVPMLETVYALLLAMQERIEREKREVRE